jgi:hypothetical protein
MLLFALLVFLQLAVLGVFVWIGIKLGFGGQAPYQDPPSKTATPDGGTVPPPFFTREPTGEPTETPKPDGAPADAGKTVGIVVGALVGLGVLGLSVKYALEYYQGGGVPDAKDAANEYVDLIEGAASLPGRFKGAKKQMADWVELARQEKNNVEKFVARLADSDANKEEKDLARKGIQDSLQKMSEVYNKVSSVARAYARARNPRPRYEDDGRTQQTIVEVD